MALPKRGPRADRKGDRAQVAVRWTKREKRLLKIAAMDADESLGTYLVEAALERAEREASQ